MKVRVTTKVNGKVVSKSWEKVSLGEWLAIAKWVFTRPWERSYPKVEITRGREARKERG